MIKVVHLITLLEFGGAQGNTIHTVLNLDLNQYESHLWAGKGAYWDTDIQKAGLSKDRLVFLKNLVRPIHPIKDFLAIFELKALLQSVKPKILHTHSSKAGIIGRIAGKMAGVPVIIHTFHGFGINDQQMPWTKALFLFLERYCAKKTDKLIFVSEANMQTARELNIGKESQYTLIRSGVPISVIEEKAKSANKSAVKKALNIPQNKKVITTIGPFKPQKNLQDFLEIAKQVASKRKDVAFLMVGDGELREEFEHYRSENQLEGILFMPGWRRDIPEILSISDVFLMTSLWEGLPRSLVEALIVGVPAVCYATDGVTDLLSTAIPKKEWNKAASLVEKYLDHPEAFLNEASAARRKIDMEFDINEMVRQQERLYASLLKK